MRNILLIFLFLLVAVPLKAQYEYFNPKNSQVGGGFGLTWIDNEPFYLFNFNPDISVGKFGVGLDLNIRINKEGNIRTEDFKDVSDYLNVIKYVRYGMKGDPLYIKIGGLSRARLGQGNIVGYYSNRSSFDTKKIGLEFDMDFEKFGFESMYSDISSGSIFGVRGYMKPLQFSPLGRTPILGDITVGATYAADFNEYSGVVSAKIDSTKKITKLEDKGTLSIIGLDLSLPIINASVVNMQLYANWAKIVNFGSGASAGLQFGFNFAQNFSVDVNFERWFNGDNFIPHYFDQFYEVDRYNSDYKKPSFVTKAGLLNNFKSPGNSWNGNLLISLMNLVEIQGYYQRFDNIPNSGMLRLATDLSPKDGKIVIKGYYDKTNIGNEKDIFTLDERSMLTGELGYKPFEYVIVSILYLWTFAPERDKNDNVIGYVTQKRVEPRVSFVFPFDISGNQQRRK